MGTIFRTASAFGIACVASTREDFDPYQKKVIDASRGAVFHSKWQPFSSPAEAMKALKKEGYQIVATALEGSKVQSLTELKAQPTAIVFGNETTGISEEVKQLGRNLSCAATWMRKVFDHQLREASDISAEEAIAMMILACDEVMKKEKLEQESGADLTSLIKKGYIHLIDPNVEVTEKGRELIAKIWNIQESVENQVLKGFTPQEKQQVLSYLKRIQDNCDEIVKFD